MNAEVVATGEEIRTGALIDSNSAHIADKLEENGVAVTRHTCVGDNLEYLSAVFSEIGSRVDIAVVTGGLGPTADDLTAEAAAKAAGVRLELDPSALHSVEAFFKARQRTMNAANRKQAYLPAGAQCIPNPVGTAPGFCLQIGRCQFFCLPGVPAEMRRMLADAVLPQIVKRVGNNRLVYRKRTLTTLGLTESRTFEQLAGFEKAFPLITLGFQVKFPAILVKLYATGTQVKRLDEDLEAAARWVTQKMGPYVVSQQGDPIEKIVGDLLIQKQASLALAESCTGGLIADMITNVSGSSAYFVFSGVSYSNQAKIDILRVSPKTLESHGAVHEETAIEMAIGARDISGATYGLSTSGIAGPTGGTQDKPVGTVCIGLATPEETSGHRFHFWLGSRSMHKQMFAAAALDVLRRRLLDVDPPRY
ncbi:MAG: competence/damage-inducible protein A [Desulfobacterales bacterium]|jgi:nicotinamide-nucleotide amidase